MTMTESSFPSARTLRGWFLGARRLFAAKPPSLRINGSHPAAVPTRVATEPANFSAMARSQVLRPSAVRDPARRHTADGTAADDWDLLFRAALAQQQPMRESPSNPGETASLAAACALGTNPEWRNCDVAPTLV